MPRLPNLEASPSFQLNHSSLHDIKRLHDNFLRATITYDSCAIFERQLVLVKAWTCVHSLLTRHRLLQPCKDSICVRSPRRSLQRLSLHCRFIDTENAMVEGQTETWSLRHLVFGQNVEPPRCSSRLQVFVANRRHDSCIQYSTKLVLCRKELSPVVLMLVQQIDNAK